MKTRKELKEAYKQRETRKGVFQIRNLVNDMRLIDTSTDIDAKWNRHQAQLRFGDHRTTSFQQAWNQYGADKFVFEVLSELEVEEGEAVDYTKELKVLEEMVLEEMDLGDGMLYNR